MIINSMVFDDSYSVAFVKNEIGSLKDREILIKNKYSLISPGTELALFMGTHVGFKDPEIAWAKYPIAPGYASVGEVVKTGGKVDCCKIGDVVFHYGTHADYTILDIDKNLYYPVRKDADMAKVLFARFCQISYTAVAASQNKTGNVLIYGAGMIGNFCAQIYKVTTGRRVFVADLSENRLEMARRCGLETINPGKGDCKELFSKATDGEGFSTVVEATGVPAVVNDCLRAVNEHGEVMFLGSTRGYVEVDVYKNIHRKFLTIYGAHENRYPMFGSYPSKKAFGDNAIKFIHEGKIHVDGFITDHIKPEQAQEAYQWLVDDRDHHLGIIIHWEED